jgi:hypothetical protein
VAYANAWQDFEPIPAIKQTGHADIILMALSANEIVFQQPVSDPWYMANGEDGSGNQTFYFSPNPASFLGCKVQHQWCNPNVNGDESCTLLSGFEEAFAQAESLFERASQNASWYATSWAISAAADIGGVVTGLGSTALTSRFGLNFGIQSPLPSNQWELDVEHTHAVTLAYMQRIVVEQATGPTEENVQRFFIGPKHEQERQAYCLQVKPFPWLIVFC